MIDLTNSEKLVLEYLALNGPSIASHIPELTSFTSSTAPRSLEEMGLVTRKHQRTLDNLRPHSLVNLTTWGLAVCIYNRGNESGVPLVKDMKLSAIVQIWKEHLLPFVLGKWDFFVKENVEDIAYLNLILAIHSLFRESIGPVTIILELKDWKKKIKKWRKENRSEPYMEIDPRTGKEFYVIQANPPPFAYPNIATPEEQEERFGMWFYNQDLHITSEKTKRWFEACSKDDEIRIYLLECLDRFIKGNTVQTERMETNRRILQ